MFPCVIYFLSQLLSAISNPRCLELSLAFLANSTEIQLYLLPDITMSFQTVRCEQLTRKSKEPYGCISLFIPALHKSDKETSIFRDLFILERLYEKVGAQNQEPATNGIKICTTAATNR